MRLGRLQIDLSDLGGAYGLSVAWWDRPCIDVVWFKLISLWKKWS